MVLSYIPCIQATHPPYEGVRRGAGGSGNKPGQKAHSLPALGELSGRGGHEKGDPGLLRKTGAYQPNGVRGVEGWGHQRSRPACLAVRLVALTIPVIIEP